MTRGWQCFLVRTAGSPGRGAGGTRGGQSQVTGSGQPSTPASLSRDGPRAGAPGVSLLQGNGYHALRVKDLVDVEPETRFLSFLQRHQTWPPAHPAVDLELSDLRSIVTVGASVAEVVSIYQEGKRPGTLLIGAPIEWTKKSLWLLPVTPQCRWEDHMDQIRLKDVTQIGFGGDYETAVLEVAGPVPPHTPPEPNTA